MLVPLSWLHDFVPAELSVDELADVLTRAGLEVEDVTRPSGGVRGVVVAEVRSVAPVPGSDRLSLVEAFDGRESGEVVCGASNFAVGDRVAWARPGATLPSSDPGTPVRIEAKKLMGVVSEGMLASPRELGLGEGAWASEGLWILDADAPLGADLAEWLGLDDPVLDVKVNPDRGYANSVLGVARDVAAMTGAPLTIPEVPPAPAASAGVPVDIEDPERTLRFDVRLIEDVVIRPSPVAVQRRLAAAGMRPRSSVVDATNYAMLETGHPTHAYDLARLAGPRIAARQARPGETVITLDGVERSCHPDDLVIADERGVIGLAGVMGGERTEVGPQTRTVLLETASFAASAVLRTARRHKLFTEASTRFEKTVPPQTVPYGAARCAVLISQLSGGAVTGAHDAYPVERHREVIRLRPDRARSLLGMDLDDDRQVTLLQAIDCQVERDGEVLAVTPPAHRPDLTMDADLCEELARLEGYDAVPERLPSTGRAGGRSPEHAARRLLRSALAGGGWTEVLVFPFIAEDDLAVLGLPDGDPRRAPIPLVNPLSRAEAVLRTTLLPGLVRTLRHNVNHGNADVAVFEIGSVFLRPGDGRTGAPGGPPGSGCEDVVLPAEPLALGLAACGNFTAARHDRPARPADLYDLLGAVQLGLRVLGRGALVTEATDEAPFHPGRAARLLVDGVDVGVAGELHPRTAEALELPPRTLLAELQLDPLLAGGVALPTAAVPSPLPSLRFDVAVVVDEQVPARAVEEAVRAGAGERLTELRLFDVYRGAQLGEGRKSLAYSLRLDDPAAQLTDADEAAAIAAVERAVAERVGGSLRR